MDIYAVEIINLMQRFIDNGWKIEIENYPLMENFVRIRVNQKIGLNLIFSSRNFDAGTSMVDFNMLQCFKELAEDVGLEV